MYNLSQLFTSFGLLCFEARFCVVVCLFIRLCRPISCEQRPRACLLGSQCMGALPVFGSAAADGA